MRNLETHERVLNRSVGLKSRIDSLCDRLFNGESAAAVRNQLEVTPKLDGQPCQLGCAIVHTTRDDLNWLPRGE